MPSICKGEERHGEVLVTARELGPGKYRHMHGGTHRRCQTVGCTQLGLDIWANKPDVPAVGKCCCEAKYRAFQIKAQKGWRRAVEDLEESHRQLSCTSVLS